MIWIFARAAPSVAQKHLVVAPSLPQEHMSKASLPLPTNRSQAQCPICPSAKSATSNKSKLMETRRSLQRPSSNRSQATALIFYRDLAQRKTREVSANFKVTPDPHPTGQGVFIKLRNSYLLQRRISGSVRNESTSPKKLIKKLPPSSPKDKSKEESVSALQR
jgi:hypothetical protein